MKLAFVIALALAAAAGCRKEEAAPSAAGGPKMSPHEMDRALEMCDGYVARLCACAAKDPSLHDECELAKSQPEGIKMHIALLKGARGPLNNEERRMTEGEVRTFQQACVDADLELEPANCPRLTAAPAATP